MLEIKNLKKIYKTKNGAAVHALDGVSLRFPETGMVFLPVYNAAKKKPGDSIRAI